MKALLTIAVLLCAHAASAIEFHIGYINTERNNREYFVGVEDAEISVMWPLEFFTSSQLDVMNDCMANRNTHAIAVVMSEDTKHDVPVRGMPGTTVTTHLPKIDSVECTEAPNFIETWRQILRNR